MEVAVAMATNIALNPHKVIAGILKGGFHSYITFRHILRTCHRDLKSLLEGFLKPGGGGPAKQCTGYLHVQMNLKYELFGLELGLGLALWNHALVRSQLQNNTVFLLC